MIKCVISLTTYSTRAKHVHEAIKQLVEMPDFHVVLTMYEPDVALLSDETNQMIKNNKVELIVTPIDYKQHKKYIKVFDKYKDVPVITIDDDVFYTKDHIERLYKAYTLHPDCVNAACIRVISKNNNGKLLNYSQWVQHYGLELEASHYNVAVGIGGVIYPPDSIHIEEDVIKKATSDDILLKVYELRNNLKVRGVQCEPLNEMNNADVRGIALWPKSIPSRDKMFLDYYNDFKILE